MSGIQSRRHPMVWVPTLYFAQGLPFAVVGIMAGFMYKKMGISNEEITWWTSMMGFAWVFKPLWSPFLEMFRSQKSVVVAFQIIGGILLLLTASSLHLPGFFTFSVALLSLVAFASATHDIASDGSYIANLDQHKQALYSGWLGAFWNGGKLFVQGGLVWLAGELEGRMGVSGAWTVAMAIPGVCLIALGLYHMWAMPKTVSTHQTAASVGEVSRTLVDVIVTFFQKPGIWLAILFILLFRAGEGQVQSVGRLFLLDEKGIGGLGMTTSDVGIAYGTVATLAFIGGSIGGGWFAAKLGLKRALFWLILAMNVPNLTFWYLSQFQPSNLMFITSILSIEMFGYGFGFTGLILYIMQVVAPGKYPTAHYALGTGIMQLGFVLFSMKSGAIQKWLGYHDFFIWCVVSAIPVLLLSRIVKIPDTLQPEASAEPANQETVLVPPVKSQVAEETPA
ncbi:MFS transporter [Burkholderiaceae bacterium DAT-1]|nr:MFS transporter [Burkholderiaceae bacterium DAT-1]